MNSRPSEQTCSANDLANLYKAHGHAIYRYLLQKTGSADSAADLAQEVFADASEACLVRGNASLSLPWLYRVAFRRFVDHIRSNRRAGSRCCFDGSEVAVAADAVELVIAREDLRRVLRELPVQQGRILLRHGLGDEPFAKIASDLDTTEAACKMAFSRARHAASQKLGAADD